MRKGITNILRDYYRLESRAYNGDFDTAVILADLLSAINSGVLTARQRQYIALYYFCGLTYAEIAHLMGIEWQDNVSKGIYNALNRISATYNRDSTVPFKQQPAGDFKGYNGALYRWLDEIAEGAPVGEPSRDVLLNISEILAHFDEKSAEMLRQYAEGFVFIEDGEAGEEYPHFSDTQIRWQNRRVSYVPEVFPDGDVIGSKRVVPKYAVDDTGEESDDGEHITRTIQQTGRRKLFKLRGN